MISEILKETSEVLDLMQKRGKWDSESGDQI